MKIFDVITIKENINEYSYLNNMKGTIVEVYNNPERAYEVEFVDENGETIEILTLYEDQLNIYWESPESEPIA